MGTITVDQDFLDQIDTLIKNYDIESAKELLSKLVIKDVPTNKRAPLARLARRTGDFTLGTKLLNENVFEKQNPSQEDLLEYIGCIRRLGLIFQSLDLLDRVEPCIDASINKAFCHIQLWEYDTAADILGQLMGNPELNATQKNIVDINYISSLEAINDLDKAETLLASFLPQVKESYLHLYLNGVNLKGKIEFKRGEYEKSITTLSEALELGGNSNFHYSLLVQKWIWLAKLYSKAIDTTDEGFQKFLTEVRKAKVWEILRDLDWRIGFLTNNRDLIYHSYFGTPFKAFKKMISESTELNFDDCFIRMGKDKNSKSPVDSLDPNNKIFPFGKDLHRLFLILSADFYQPWSVFRIFTYLYPDEIYDPSQSQNKVYRIMGRLEKELKKHDIQDCLESTSEGYRLRPFQSESFKIYEKMTFKDRESLIAYKLELSGLVGAFTAQDVKEAINLSDSQMYRTIKALKDGGYIKNAPNSNSLFLLNKAHR